MGKSMRWIDYTACFRTDSRVSHIAWSMVSLKRSPRDRDGATRLHPLLLFFLFQLLTPTILVNKISDIDASTMGKGGRDLTPLCSSIAVNVYRQASVGSFWVKTRTTSPLFSLRSYYMNL